MSIRWRNIDWYVINLDHRTDRREHMKKQLWQARIRAKRFSAYRKEDYRGSPQDVAMMQGTPNTIGNWLSHTGVIAKGLRTRRIIGVLEDDALLCEDFCERLQYIEDEFDKPWDIFFLGATVHVNESPWHGLNGEHPTPLGRDAEMTDTRHIMRTYGAFSNQGYLVNGQSAEKILEMMQERMPYSRGSDHALIQIQPELNCYCFVPGMVFQIDGPSDIGQGVTKFSSFLETLGPYVWANRLEDFDYDEWAKDRT